ncbi:PREDICTED: uncharacterized protein LOC104608070 [Nelumbo nucifera]|uniref:Uncharacterized protein LOC104608070 n=2 Tax=Nelumbo nucifera TaxID=4432 RepID=A0A1U8B8B6_NELNU|nr:PREDICTED: uncharacterized protein LOC104608070 [Nelumbo nucifera]DAD31095.1 TPA_asm: hypothetical protein HUJ06_009946 [Nelumbo nucifera]
MEGEKMKKKKENGNVAQELEIAFVMLGTILLVAGLKHALTSLLEQWRALVFLLLNLVLLSILFVSIHSSKSGTHRSTTDCNFDARFIINNNNKSKKRCSESVTAKVELHNHLGDGEGEDAAIFTEPVDDGEGSRLSKEEFNAKVEAFIVMFRQQLALDAKGRGRCYLASGSRLDPTPPLGVVA